MTIPNLESLETLRETEIIDIIPDEWPEAMEKEAYHGLAGKFIEAIEPETEADPVALLMQFLTFFGNVAGRNAYILAEAERHYPNINVVLVGASAKSRKGTSFGHVRRLFGAVEEGFITEHIASGLSSGEGLIYAVRDPVYKKVKEKGTNEEKEVKVDEGISDKRLLIYESEFASPLKILNREGNILSDIIRNAWDTGNLRSLVKNNPNKATGAHISIIGHITKQELLKYLQDNEATNGFANRFLWPCVRRSKLLPEGGQEVNLNPLIIELRQAVEFSQAVGELKKDEEAKELWAEVYPDLSEAKPGLLGAITARGEAQVIRLSLIYALLDRAPAIRAEHLAAALAVWHYNERSVKYIFGDALGDPTADMILDALKNTPQGLTSTEIYNELFNRHNSKKVKATLSDLLATGLIEYKETPTTGRPERRYFLKERT